MMLETLSLAVACDHFDILSCMFSSCEQHRELGKLRRNAIYYFELIEFMIHVFKFFPFLKNDLFLTAKVYMHYFVMIL